VLLGEKGHDWDEGERWMGEGLRDKLYAV